MDALSLSTGLVRRPPRAAIGTAVLFTFAATLFLSALLLFSVQPMIAKMVLPRLGGSPSVWAVSMCFFQVVLLTGYCYAHLLNRLTAWWLAPLIHLLLLSMVVFVFPMGLPAWSAEPSDGDTYLWLIGVLSVGVGLPFFAISANAPLLQAWFALTGHPHRRDPYFLYAASNFGSLVALLAYPTLIEPFVGLAVQRTLWTSALLVLVLMIAGAGLLMVARRQHGESSIAADTADMLKPVTWKMRARWIALALLPSGLLVAFTSLVATDIASVPFLWVIPLALYLATFVLVFRARPIVPHRLMLKLQPIMCFGVMVGVSINGNLGWIVTSTFGFAAFFITTLVCHKELYDHRPEAEHLTEFYLWMSFGGVVGGIFAALAAPQFFNTIFEFPVLLVLGMACPTSARDRIAVEDQRELAIFAGLALTAMTLLAVAMAHGVIESSAVPCFTALIGFGALTILRSRQRTSQAIFIALMGAAVAILPSAMSRGEAIRSFFGTHRLEVVEGGQLRVLMHGTTIHGAERIKRADGTPITSPLPATYYHPWSPLARAVDLARAAGHKTSYHFRAGIVGLGAGSMACYAQPGESWRFFEIDPVVVRIARDPQRFTFLARCMPQPDIVLGDARLTLAKEKTASFDYLMLDAFASDSVPTHLLTVEALKLYLDKLADTGVLALHVSNRHLDLVSVASAMAAAVPGIVAAAVHDEIESASLDAAPSDVILIAKREMVLSPVLTVGQRWPGARRIEKTELRPWTDDYSNIITALLRKYWH
jgi:hypothetical protein